MWGHEDEEEEEDEDEEEEYEVCAPPLPLRAPTAHYPCYPLLPLRPLLPLESTTLGVPTGQPVQNQRSSDFRTFSGTKRPLPRGGA